MMGKIEPDFNIRIGIKDGKIVCVDWSELSKEVFDMESIDVIKIISKYLRKSIKFIRR